MFALIVLINSKFSNMKLFYFTFFALLISKVSFAQYSSNTYYTFTAGTNIIDNNNNVDNLIPFINGKGSYKMPFFGAADLHFDSNSKFSISALLTTNQLEIKGNDKAYIAFDLLGKYYFNDYLFDSESLQLYLSLGAGRYFLDGNGSNTLNYSGGVRYWFSERLGLESQLIGKYGLRPLNIEVINHYQLNFGIVWRSENY